MRHFCTYFDLNYLPRGLALYRSLRQVCPSFRLWILCMDAESRRLLTHLCLPEVRLIALEELEREDPELLAVKASRSRLEYYFTCSPVLPLHVLRCEPTIDLITYLDADLYCFSNVEPIFDELSSYSIGITAHRFPPSLLHLEEYGRYNVGWLMFRNDQQGLECLQSWRRCCLEWCYDRCEDGRFADQKYLDEWPSRFSQTKVLQHAGLNAAPWNLAGTVVTGTLGGLRINGQPLVCFHFHGFKRLWSWLYEPNLGEYHATLSAVVRKGIFEPYLQELTAIEADLRHVPGAPVPGNRLKRGGVQGSNVGMGIATVRRWLRIGRGLATGQYLIQFNGRVL